MATLQDAPPPRLIPPHLVLRDALEAAVVEALFDYACAHEADFTPSALRRRDGEGGLVNDSFRKSLQLPDVGPALTPLRRLVFDRAAELMGELRMSAVGTLTSFETQLVANRDGGFLKQHKDTATADRNRPDVRVLSGVYYFHWRPKAFSGGELRLFDIADPGRSLEVEPTHNTLVLFPAWALHEVAPVSCPSGRFADSRFSVNCWVYATLPAPKGEAERR